jgi:voltage-gated potassium channel
MHEHGIELRLEEVEIPKDSPLAGLGIGPARVRDRTGAMVLARRDQSRVFITNPSADTIMAAGQILIAIGTPAHLQALALAAHRRLGREEVAGEHETR